MAQFIQNPYWQHFCGYNYFQLDPPCNPSSMTRWNNRFDKDGGEKMLEQTIITTINNGDIKGTDFKRVTVDTTVQEKNITFPTNKVYSFHEDVECIAKGKAHKRYEFGNKGSYATTAKSSYILGAFSFRNEFGGDTLLSTLQQT